MNSQVGMDETAVDNVNNESETSDSTEESEEEEEITPEKNQFMRQCFLLQQNLTVLRHSIKQLTNVKDEIQAKFLPPSVKVSFSLAVGEVFRSMSNLEFPALELMRLIELYSAPWDAKCAALKGLQDNYEQKRRLLDIAIKRLTAFQGEMHWVRKEKVLLRWEKLYYKAAISKGTGRNWKFRIDTIRREAQKEGPLCVESLLKQFGESKAPEHYDELLQTEPKPMDPNAKFISEERDGPDRRYGPVKTLDLPSPKAGPSTKKSSESDSSDVASDSDQKERKTKKKRKVRFDQEDAVKDAPPPPPPPPETADAQCWTHEREFRRFLWLRLAAVENYKPPSGLASYTKAKFVVTSAEQIFTSNVFALAKTDAAAGAKAGGGAARGRGAMARGGRGGGRGDFGGNAAVAPLGNWELMFDSNDKKEKVRITLMGLAPTGKKEVALASCILEVDDFEAMDPPKIEWHPDDKPPLEEAAAEALMMRVPMETASVSTQQQSTTATAPTDKDRVCNLPVGPIWLMQLQPRVRDKAILFKPIPDAPKPVLVQRGCSPVGQQASVEDRATSPVPELMPKPETVVVQRSSPQSVAAPRPPPPAKARKQQAIVEPPPPANLVANVEELERKFAEQKAELEDKMDKVLKETEQVYETKIDDMNGTIEELRRQLHQERQLRSEIELEVKSSQDRRQQRKGSGDVAHIDGGVHRAATSIHASQANLSTNTKTSTEGGSTKTPRDDRPASTGTQKSHRNDVNQAQSTIVQRERVMRERDHGEEHARRQLMMRHNQKYFLADAPGDFRYKLRRRDTDGLLIGTDDEGNASVLMPVNYMPSKMSQFTLPPVSPVTQSSQIAALSQSQHRSKILRQMVFLEERLSSEGQAAALKYFKTTGARAKGGGSSKKEEPTPPIASQVNLYDLESRMAGKNEHSATFNDQRYRYDVNSPAP